MLPTFFLLSLFYLPFSLSSPLSTVAIAHISNVTLICAFLPSPQSNLTYDLNCTSVSRHVTRNYPSGRSPFSAIAAGDGFLCALGPTLTLQSNYSTMLWWEFGNNTVRTKRVYRGPQIVALSASDYHVCGIQRDHASSELYCWRWPELDIPPELVFSDIAVGNHFLCGLLYDSGRIRCFGNQTGVVGHEPPDGNYTTLAAGKRHACAISNQGKLVCWGNEAPKCGKAEIKVNSLALGTNRTCVLGENGRVFCWGPDSAPPASLSNAQFVSIHAKNDALCGVLMVNFSLICWGKKEFESNHVVFNRVLPGPCVPLNSCPCGVLADSANLCPHNGCICQLCVLELVKHSWAYLSNKREMIFVIVGAVGLCFVFVACQILITKWYKNRHGIHLPDTPSSRRLQRGHVDSPIIEQRLSELFAKGLGNTIDRFTIANLQSVTDGFSENYRIGSGSFGSVYRATLADGLEVAIKRAEPGTTASTSTAPARRRDRETAFVSELALLSRINHKNLVRLLGFCTDEGERILLYEYMSNGTLHDNLHKKEPLPTPLATWQSRLKIALDVARGIEYMHAYAIPPMIHRDIKSSNILIDKNWVAKVADFGLALVNTSEGEQGEQVLEQEELLTAGTVGYMDPEYYRLQRLTDKSDVYSFGVVLLELLSGCRVIQRYGESGTPRNVVEFAVPYITADDIHPVLDPRLPLPTPSETEAVAYVGYLAADCVSPAGQDRPNMTEVVCGLERAVAACTPEVMSRCSTAQFS